MPQKLHLVQGGLLADKDEEDEASAEKVDATDGPQNKLGCWKTLGCFVVSVGKVMRALKDPRDTHHNEQLTVEDLEEKERNAIVSYKRGNKYFCKYQMRNISYHLLLCLLVDSASGHICVDDQPILFLHVLKMFENLT